MVLDGSRRISCSVCAAADLKKTLLLNHTVEDIQVCPWCSSFCDFMIFYKFAESAPEASEQSPEQSQSSSSICLVSLSLWLWCCSTNTWLKMRFHSPQQTTLLQTVMSKTDEIRPDSSHWSRLRKHQIGIWFRTTCERDPGLTWKKKKSDFMSSEHVSHKKIKSN